MKNREYKKILDSLIKSLEESPEKDRLRWCPQTKLFHLVAHRTQDFIEGTNNEYNNKKKRLNKFNLGGPVEELPEVNNDLKFVEIDFEMPSYEELDEIVLQQRKKIKSLEAQVRTNDKLKSEAESLKVDLEKEKAQSLEKDKVIAEKEKITSESITAKDIIINQQNLKLQEFEKNTVAGRKDTILSILAKGPIKTTILRSLGAVIDDWHGTATLFGYNLRKVFFRDEYIIVAGNGS